MLTESHRNAPVWLNQPSVEVNDEEGENGETEDEEEEEEKEPVSTTTKQNKNEIPILHIAMVPRDGVDKSLGHVAGAGTAVTLRYIPFNCPIIYSLSYVLTFFRLFLILFMSCAHI